MLSYALGRNRRTARLASDRRRVGLKRLMSVAMLATVIKAGLADTYSEKELQRDAVSEASEAFMRWLEGTGDDWWRVELE